MASEMARLLNVSPQDQGKIAGLLYDFMNDNDVDKGDWEEDDRNDASDPEFDDDNDEENDEAVTDAVEQTNADASPDAEYEAANNFR